MISLTECLVVTPAAEAAGVPRKVALREEARGWRWMARWIATHGIYGGLCINTWRVKSRVARCGMRDRLVQHFVETHPGACYFDDPGVASTRILLCLVLAHEAEDEADAL